MGGADVDGSYSGGAAWRREAQAMLVGGAPGVVAGVALRVRAIIEDMLRG